MWKIKKSNILIEKTWRKYEISTFFVLFLFYDGSIMGLSYNFLDIEKWENESMKQYLLRHKVASLVVVLLSFLENASSIISI